MSLDNFKIKSTPLNKKHNQIRSAHALGLDKEKKQFFNEYKTLGGKRTMKQLLNVKPIRVSEKDVKKKQSLHDLKLHKQVKGSIQKNQKTLTVGKR